VVCKNEIEDKGKKLRPTGEITLFGANQSKFPSKSVASSGQNWAFEAKVVVKPPASYAKSGRLANGSCGHMLAI